MSEEFDPRWEYYIGDPEIEELLSESSRSSGFDTIFDYRGDIQSRPVFGLGLRFGTGDPDRFLPFQSKKPITPDGRVNNGGHRNGGRPKVIDQWRYCKACGVRYSPNRGRRIYCSEYCGKVRRFRDRKRRLLSEEKVCKTCKVKFLPDKIDREYCSRKCGAGLGGKKVEQWKLDRFKEMYLAGERMEDICKAVGVNLPLTLKRWRRKLKLPSRKPGNFTKHRKQGIIS